MSTSRLVIGAGGTGRTHRLRSWLASTGDPGSPSAVWLTGSPLRFVAAHEVSGALEAAGPATIVVADDLQWFEPAALAALTDAAAGCAILASRRPADGTEPDPRALDLLTDILTRTEPAHRLGLLDPDDFGPAVSALRNPGGPAPSGSGPRALATAELSAMHQLTGGSMGLAADVVAAGWDPTSDNLSPELVDAVTGRVHRAGHEVLELVRTWAVAEADGQSEPDAGEAGGHPGAGHGLTVALRALAQGPVVDGAGPDGPPGEGRGELSVDVDQLERALRSAGLVGADGTLLPLIGRAVAADLTSSQRAAAHDRLAAVLARSDPPAAARHLLAGAGRVPDAARILAAAALHAARSRPDQVAGLIDRAEELGLAVGEAAILRALGDFHRGSPRALGHLERAETDPVSAGDERVALIGFGLDLRELRFASAAGRPLGGVLAEPLLAVARALDGRPPLPADGGGQGPEAGDTTARRAPLAQVAADVAAALAALANGRPHDALNGFVGAADDLDRLDPTAPLGFTPHGLGALAAGMTGDLAAVEHLCTQALGRGSGGHGEVLFHQLIQAYGRMIRGDYRLALEILRQHRPAPARGGDEPFASSPSGEAATGFGSGFPTGEGADSLPQRDRLGLAALEAAIARRSGDTGRLRSAWQEAEQALLRPSISWLLNDLFTELLCAGARVGNRRRVEPIARGLLDQAIGLPAAGPGPTSGWWLWLQVGMALDDTEMVTTASDRLARLAPADDRSRARVSAAALWAGIVTGARVGDDEVVAVAERMTAIGDGWEASRLLGQAALDTGDPRSARRLLELARVSSSEPVDEAGDDALVGLGLSEREGEVALMVVEGRTHKEIGAQLFISPKTVEHHVAKIRQKLGATSRAELVAMIREAVGSA